MTHRHPYFSARTEGRISYGHLGRTDSCFTGDVRHWTLCTLHANELVVRLAVVKSRIERKSGICIYHVNIM